MTDEYPLYTTFPRWLEFSGLPCLLEQRQSGAWTVYKYLCETEMGANALPGSFDLDKTRLAASVGLTPKAVARILEELEEGGWIEIEDARRSCLCRIASPPPGIDDPEEILQRLDDAGFDCRGLYLRYLGPGDPEDYWPIVRDLYQRAFATRMNANTMQSLLRICATYPLEAIEQVFDEVLHHESRSLRWVRKRLEDWRKKDGHVPQTRR